MKICEVCQEEVPRFGLGTWGATESIRGRSLSQNLVSGGVGTPLQVGQKRAQSPKVETSKRQCPEVVNRIKVGMWVYQSVWLVIRHTVILHILCIWYAFIICILYHIEPYRLYLCLLLTLTPIQQCIYLCYWWLIKCHFSVLYKSRFLSLFRLILQDLVTQFFSFGSQGKREGGERKSRDGSQPGDFCDGFHAWKLANVCNQAEKSPVQSNTPRPTSLSQVATRYIGIWHQMGRLVIAGIWAACCFLSAGSAVW